MKNSWGFILLGTALIAAGWVALYTILGAIDIRVASSETKFTAQLIGLNARVTSSDKQFVRELTLIRSEAKEMRNDIRYIRNNISTDGTVSMERR